MIATPHPPLEKVKEIKNMLDHYDINELKNMVQDKCKILETRYDKNRSLKMWESCKRINENIMKYEHILKKLKSIQNKGA